MQRLVQPVHGEEDGRPLKLAERVALLDLERRVEDLQRSVRLVQRVLDDGHVTLEHRAVLVDLERFLEVEFGE